MLFNSLQYFVFFFIVLFAYWGLRENSARLKLLFFASVFFYATWNPPFVLLLFVSVGVDFVCARRIAGQPAHKAIYLALGVNLEGHKELLGLWLSENEGAKFWLNVLTELQNRGVKNILIACVDGLKGFPDAIASTFPET